MRAIELALFIMSLQVGLGLVATFGGFGSVPYESKITGVKIITANRIQTIQEQRHAAWSVLTNLYKILTWSWIKDMTQPWYSQNAGVKAIVDFIVGGLDAVTLIIYAAALVTFIGGMLRWI